MKTLYISICFVLVAVLLQAQTPAGFNYQAIIRNETGKLVKNRNIGIRFTILKDAENGVQVYSESINPATNQNGLVTAEIGKSDPTQFSQIDWSAGTYFIKTETDINGGSNYTISGISQLLSVPFALYAVKSGDGFSGYYNDLSEKPSLSTVATTGSFTDLLNVPILVTLMKNPQAGDILYNNGTNWELLTRGINGQTLRLDNGMPKWGEPGYALPMVTTSEVSEIIQTSAQSGGNVIATGFTNITARGVCWSTNQSPTIADGKTTEGTGIGTFTSKMTNLQQNTTYYVRAYATNGAGTAYGNQVSFKTMLNVVFPTVTTSTATNITSTAVTSGGNVTATGGGEITARGVCWSDHQNPTIEDSKTTDGAGTGEFMSQVSGLIPGTFYLRAYATNSAGTGYGNMLPFTTEKTLPVLTTKAITEISAMGCISGGNISSAGGGTISGRGICWSDSPNPTIANEKTTSTAIASSFSAAIAKASPGTSYYLKAYATNEIGTGYGDQKTFTTSDAQYYTSFESGITPVGWSGSSFVTNEKALNGSYSYVCPNLLTCVALLNVTLTTSGQISFFYSFNASYHPYIDFYIDDVKVDKLISDGSIIWKQYVTAVSAGKHSFKWEFHNDYGNVFYLDQIVITK